MVPGGAVCVAGWAGRAGAAETPGWRTARSVLRPSREAEQGRLGRGVDRGSGKREAVGQGRSAGEDEQGF